MLLFPELFVPNKPVIGASRTAGMLRQDLKFFKESSLITMFAFLLSQKTLTALRPSLQN